MKKLKNHMTEITKHTKKAYCFHGAPPTKKNEVEKN